MTKILKIFAGPNGSGKTTLKDEMQENGFLSELYVNPDDIEKQFRLCGELDLSNFKIQTTQQELWGFFRSSQLLKLHNKLSIVDNFRLENTIVFYTGQDFDSYIASIFSDFIRKKILSIGESLAFETVMSSLDKIEILKLAKEQGYKVILYFIATKDVRINLQRIQTRVAFGGHNVPEDKVRSRYIRSLDNLFKALQYCDKAFLFDNSGHKHEPIAEITNINQQIEIFSEHIPYWFKKFVLDK